MLKRLKFHAAFFSSDKRAKRKRQNSRRGEMRKKSLRKRKNKSEKKEMWRKNVKRRKVRGKMRRKGEKQRRERGEKLFSLCMHQDTIATRIILSLSPPCTLFVTTGPSENGLFGL